jgi:AraC family transcriptional regulator, transcriptional activator of pobA
MQQAVRSVPTYALYGEKRPVAAPDFPEFLLHCEEIHERSRVHGWEIRPHRHKHYFQILYIAAGHAELTDGRGFRPVNLPSAILVPPGSIHGFRFSHDVEGFVVTIATARLQAMLGTDCAAVLSARDAAAIDLAPDEAGAARVASLLCDIPREYRERRRGHQTLIEGQVAAALSLLSRIGDDANMRSVFGAEAADGRTALLLRLIEAHYREHRPVGFYAAALGLSTTHLNRIARAAHGRTVRALLAERLADEAKRNLLFSVQTVKAIALQLGFTDVAYFSRFFHHATGMAPTVYRRVRQDRQA